MVQRIGHSLLVKVDLIYRLYKEFCKRVDSVKEFTLPVGAVKHQYVEHSSDINTLLL